jgi:hypothetical protein
MVPRLWLDELDRAALPLLALVLLVAGLATLYIGRGLTFRIDDWDAILHRHGLEALLLPHGGDHLNFLPFALYKVILRLFGADSYTPFLVVLVLSHLAVVALLFVYVSRRAGRGLALLSILPFSVLGYGYLDLLWAWQVNYNGAVWFGVAALFLMSFRTRRTDVLAAISLAIAILWDTSALPFMAGAGVIALASPERRARWWVPLPSIVVFGAWWLKWGSDYTLLGQSDLTLLQRARLAPEYMVELASAAVGGLLGVGPGLDGHGSEAIGAAVAALVLALLIARLWVARIDDVPQFLGVAATALAYWGILGLTRADVNEAFTSYYVYVGAALVLLVGAEAVGRPPLLVNRQLAVIGAVFVAAMALNFAELASRGPQLRTEASIQRARLGALELAREHASEDYVPDIGIGDMPDDWAMGTAGPYLRGVAHHGSHAFSPEDLLGQPEYIRGHADRELARLEVQATARGGTAAATGSSTLQLEPVKGATVSRNGRCAIVASAGERRPLAVSFRSKSGSVAADWPGRTAARIEGRRFAEGLSRIATLPPGPGALVKVRPDGWRHPWVIELNVNAPRLTLCPRS